MRLHERDPRNIHSFLHGRSVLYVAIVLEFITILEFCFAPIAMHPHNMNFVPLNLNEEFLS